jgi:hypothetical protein
MVISNDIESELDSVLSNALQEMTRRDFRINKPKYDSLPMSFKEYCEWKNKNMELINAEEFVRSILSRTHPTTLKSVIRILDRFANSNLITRKNVIVSILQNDRFVKSEIKLKSQAGKLELDLDQTLLYLSMSSNVSTENENTCYG